MIRKEQAGDGGFGLQGALWNRGHAAEGDSRIEDSSTVELETEGAHQGGNILVEALGNLVAAEHLARLEPRHDYTGQELARRPILFSVSDEELFKGQAADCAFAAQLYGCSERDQCRRSIAYRRTVGDVAADGTGGANLLRTQAAQQLAHIGIQGGEMLFGTAVGRRRTDHQSLVSRFDNVKSGAMKTDDLG